MVNKSKRKIEMSSKNILERVFLSSDIISSDISTNDKTPSFDGTLTLYKKEYTVDGNISDGKKNIEGIIDIQLKGKFVENIDQQDKETISYAVEIS